MYGNTTSSLKGRTGKVSVLDKGLVEAIFVLDPAEGLTGFDPWATIDTGEPAGLQSGVRSPERGQ